MRERHHVVEFWGDPATWQFRGEDDTEYVVVTESELTRLRAVEAAAREVVDCMPLRGIYYGGSIPEHNAAKRVNEPVKRLRAALRQALAVPGAKEGK